MSKLSPLLSVLVFLLALVALAAANLGHIRNHPDCEECELTGWPKFMVHISCPNRYYVCGPGGHAWDMPCPKPLVWNQAKLTCDWCCDVHGATACRALVMCDDHVLDRDW